MIYENLAPYELVKASIESGEAKLSKDGSLVVETGIYTGRSPNAKFIVKDKITENTVDWGDVNKPITQETFDEMFLKIQEYMADKLDNVFVQNVYVGADKKTQHAIRITTEFAWHNLFVSNMFVMPTRKELEDFVAEYMIICVPGVQEESFIYLNLSKKMILIGGTEYAGEIKKSAFTLMNYLLPEIGVMPMHCSVNVGDDGSSAVFFGLSGTGKTTLSSDSSRQLVGDDEHGWGDDGLFNFEGGCYAKVIRLDPKAEPEIYETCHMPGTILENVVMDSEGNIDLDDGSITENTRGSYPLEYIPNIVPSGLATHPKNILMLTCDAFGVLPPLSRLSVDEAVYYFLSGYTAKVAGTERGLGKEPQATFSTCFGAPFMPRHPSVYASLLKAKIEEHDAKCWLVNTGWIGGGYGVGERISIKHTRRLVSSVLNSELDDVSYVKEDTFGLMIPSLCEGVPGEILIPKLNWDSQEDYDQISQKLITDFQENFKQYEEFFKGNFKL